MSSRRLTPVAVLATCGLLAGVGCGGGSSDPAPAPTTPAVTATTGTVETGPATTAPPATTGPEVTEPGTETSTTATPPTPTPTRTVGAGTFVDDVTEFSGILTQFGLTLQAAAEGPEALQARSQLLRGQLDDLDEVVDRMGGYRVEDAPIESRRAAIVAASPEVSRLGRELVDAAEAGDAARTAEVAQEFTTALTALQRAAAGG